MYEFFPLIAVGAVLGIVSVIFIAAYMTIRKQSHRL